MSDPNTDLAGLEAILSDFKARAETQATIDDTMMKQTVNLLSKLASILHGGVRTRQMRYVEDAIVVARHTCTSAMAARDWPRFVYVDVMLVSFLGQTKRFLESDEHLKEIEKWAGLGLEACQQYNIQADLEHLLSGCYFPVREEIFQKTGTLLHLDAATSVGERYLRSAEKLVPDFPNPDQIWKHAAAIGLLMMARSKLAGSLNRQELEWAKSCLELSLREKNSDEKIQRQSWLSNCCGVLYESSGDSMYLTEAIRFGSMACGSLDQLPESARYTACCNLAGFLRNRYDKRQARKDLVACQKFTTQALEYLSTRETSVAENSKQRSISILNESGDDDKCTLLSALTVGSWQLYDTGMAHKLLDTKSYEDLVTLSKELLYGDTSYDGIVERHFRDAISHLKDLFQHAKTLETEGKSALQSLLNLGSHTEEMKQHVENLSKLVEERKPQSRTAEQDAEAIGLDVNFTAMKVELSALSVDFATLLDAKLNIPDINSMQPENFYRKRGEWYAAKQEFEKATEDFHELRDMCQDEHIKVGIDWQLAKCYDAQVSTLATMWDRSTPPSSDHNQKAAAKHFKAGLYYESVLHASSYPILWRVNCGIRAAMNYYALEAYDRGFLTIDSVMDLWPKLGNFLQSRSDQQSLMESMWIVPSQAAYGAIFSNYNFSAGKIVSILEKGSSVIAGFVSDFRSEAPGLEGRHKQLWQEHKKIKERLNSIDSVPKTLSTVTQALHETNTSVKIETDLKDLTKVEERIRRIPGYENFLKPLEESDFISLAKDGPIVTFMATEMGCSAYLVTFAGVVMLSLPDFTFEKAHQFASQIVGDNRLTRNLTLENNSNRSQQLRKLLEELWSCVVDPVLKALKIQLPSSGSDPQRIWWITSGEMGMLPFHAAGIYPEDEEATEYAARYVTSSYSPTIKALSFARRKEVTPVSSPKHHVSVIAMETTPNSKRLEVQKEITILKNTFNKNALPDARVLVNHCKACAKTNLDECTIAHFGCHGVTDAGNPSNSALLLGTTSATVAERLTVNEMATISLDKAQIAYLSACSTAQNAAPRLVNETIHIVSTFQLMGFSHVISTLWEIEDSPAINTTKHFYKNLGSERWEGRYNHDSIAYSFAEAVETLRRDDPEDFFNWVPFVHYGA